MSDCKRSDIPDELIEQKGFFHCKGLVGFPNTNIPPYYGCSFSLNGREYLPTDGDVIAEGLTTVGNSVSRQALVDAIGPQFILHNVAFEDDYMSWESDEIVVAESPVQSSIINDIQQINCPSFDCCGFQAFHMFDGTIVKMINGNLTNIPCGGFVPTDLNPFTGLRPDIGWFGTTLQFYLNIYKVYCCTRNENGDVIDYDYSFRFTTSHKRDGVLCIDDIWPLYYHNSVCDFCYPTLTGSQQGLTYPHHHITLVSFMIPGSYYIPVSTEEP